MKTKIPRSIAFACALAALAACRMQDIRTVTIEVPDLKNDQCTKIILAELAKADGIQPDTIRFGANSVTMTYDSMKLAIKNIEFIIAKAGFTANETPADPTARAALPAECR